MAQHNTFIIYSRLQRDDSYSFFISGFDLSFECCCIVFGVHVPGSVSVCIRVFRCSVFIFLLSFKLPSGCQLKRILSLLVLPVRMWKA